MRNLLLRFTIRPYDGDVPNDRSEFRAPGNPSPLLDEFDADNMGLDTLTSTAGITARWLLGYISHHILEVAKENKKTGGN